ncbi:hypothetical protein FSP39_025491 [Pinctada imbricata]|uniref:G-protein coupled receptors family 1 profile domain-containing protein n=1 Tax=Pinctada imbricata TaxID=66713 RepID=A0AA89BVI8_PINIB|nr:hypothetical protein FSP39_025491 [Pinctada imbricata]
MENVTYLDTSSQSFVTQKINESIVPPSLQFLFGSGGNIIAIVILFVTSKRHKWKPFQRLVSALALTDLYGNILVYPFVIKRYASDFTYDFPYALCQHITFTFSFAFLASAMLVMMMSLDRFLAILFPFVYNVPRKILRTHLLIITTWLSSGIISILPIAGVGKVKLFYPGSWCFIDYANKENYGEIMTYIYAIIGIVNMIKSINNPHSKEDKTELFVIRLAIANSNINPWIYIFLRKENLKLVEQLFNHWRRHGAEQSEPSATTNNTSNESRTDI